MAWHPRLVVRFTKGDGIFSPTSGAGYALFAAAALSVGCGFIAAALQGELLFLLALVLPGLFLRDAWARFAATPAEREAFLAEIAELRALGHAPPPNEVLLGQGWGPGVLAAVLAALAVSLVLLFVLGEPVLIPVVLALAGFAGLEVLDLVRRRRALRR